MLKQENRLKSKRSYTATYNNKNIVSTDSIVLYAGKIKTDKNCPTRVGFVVSKKVHKRAVKRNKIKRLMRENIRLILKNKELTEINNYQSLIFMAKENILEKNFEEIRNTILILMDKLANKNI
ncbi:MAG: ribonuclease P protein component [Candidatus Gastranaerophilales bacterium]|nr:ribonuclease P protein component [Candidatus Gastranaerophilales bacterium]